MGSRLRENVKQLFECFCEVAQPNGEKQPWILQKFPDTYNDTEVLKSVPKFAYPCELENTTIQHFSFVLTSIDSKWTFGFCRHDPKTETALVVLSALAWHETFYKLLNHIATLTASKYAGDLWQFLADVYEANIPISGASIGIPLPDGKTTFMCQRPKQFQLPSIPENRNLTEYFSAVDSHNMMMIFASMLYERRIIFTSKRLSRLSACVQACNALIYPMIWQHIYIPVLPISLMDYLLAPMPFLIGVPSPILERVRQSDLGEVVVLNADDNTIQSPFQDLESLPQDVVTNLRRALRNRPALLGDGVSRAFLRALVQLTAGYREALTLQQGEAGQHMTISFDQDAFVESRPISMQPFLRKMLELQIFQQFIEERLHMLNSGLGFSDEFEMEACNYSDKSGNKFMQQYREWTYAMRKEGSAFIRSVKDRANPAVKSAVKSVKDKGKDMKTACKGLKWKGRTSRGDNFHHHHHHQPRSAPSSPTLDRRPISSSYASPSKSPSGLTPTSSYRKELRIRNSNVETSRKQYSPLSPSSPEEQDCSPPPARLDIDLMHELRDVIFPNTPPVDRSLKPVRSLDSLRSTSTWSGSSTTTNSSNSNNSTTAGGVGGGGGSSSISSRHRRLQGPPLAPTPTSAAAAATVITSSSKPLADRPAPYEYYHLPKRQQQRPSITDNSNNSNNDLDAKLDDANKDNDVDDYDSDNDMRTKKKSFLSRSKDAKTTTTTTTTHEFSNPFVAIYDQPKALLANRLRTDNPFEIYGASSGAAAAASSALNSHLNGHAADPFDTSRALDPFGISDPLFRSTSSDDTTTSTTAASSKQQQHRQQQHQLYGSSKASNRASPLRKERTSSSSTSEVQDLIRLDSTNSSEEDFDPLLQKAKRSDEVDAAGLPKNMSQSLQMPVIMGEGLSNPLYPYFEPQKRKSDLIANNQTRTGDLDLLQEYGLDFNKFNLSNGGGGPAPTNTQLLTAASSSSTPLTEPTYANSSNNNRPFGSPFASQQTVKSPSNWTKFE
ncbi:DENN domain-containing protein 1B isoform X1 [Trichogramma pretiosum]|uniref:DENN domain-containing protein 1B isoform X1 n=1 Tax=Trichogramma pretiosum TaxID=7493 RepID=UPI0006C9B6EA|nr:DENN domain-containing protein 1B isoform X1 [Trichogramma pretiosum]